MKTKEITNVQILKTMEKGFSNVNKRLDGIDVRLDGIDVRLDGIDVRLDGIDVRLDGVDKQISGIKTDLQLILETINESFTELETKIDIRFTNIENNLEDVRLRLNNVVYRFELDEVANQIKTLQKQVKDLIKKKQ